MFGDVGDDWPKQTSRMPPSTPRDHPLTTLIIDNAHERVVHNKVRETLTDIRSKYWILKGRNTVKSIIAQCVLCKRFEGKLFIAPPPPPLPKFRVQKSRPLSNTAVDFVGPLHVKSLELPRARRCGFALIHAASPVLFTSMSYRTCLQRSLCVASRGFVQNVAHRL